MDADDKVAKHLQAARSLREGGLFRAAYAQLEQAQSLAPRDANVLGAWGETLALESNPAGAVERLRAALAVDPARNDLRVRLAEVLCDSKQPAPAEHEYRQVLGAEPAHAAALAGLARILRERGAVDEAWPHLRAALEADPQVPGFVRYLETIAALPPGERSADEARLDQLLQVDARFVPALLVWADALEREGRLDDALREYGRVRELNPDSDAGRRGTASVLSLRSPAEAVDFLLQQATLAGIATSRASTILHDAAELVAMGAGSMAGRLEDLLDQSPSNVPVYLSWADSSQPVEAERLCRRALRLDPVSHGAMHRCGRALAGQGRFGQAIEYFRQALQLDPASTEASLGWAEALLECGQTDAAVEHCRYAIGQGAGSIDLERLATIVERFPPKPHEEVLNLLESARSDGNADDHVADAHVWTRHGWHARALAALDRAAAKGAASGPFWMARGDAELEVRADAKAIESYRRAIDASPYDADLLDTIGANLHARRLYAAEVDVRRRGSENLRRDWDHRAWAWALHGLRRYDDAIEQLKQALNLRPDDAPSYIDWGQMLHAQQKYDEAIQLYLRALDCPNPFEAEVRYNQALALAAMRRHEEAVALFDAASELGYSEADCLLARGNSLDELGRRDEAIRAYERAIEFDPDFAYAFHNVANALWNRGDFREGQVAWKAAFEAYERAKAPSLRARNGDFFGYWGASLHERSADDVDAEAVLLQGVTVDPENTFVLSSLGGYYLDLHEDTRNGESSDKRRPAIYEKARRCYDQARQILQARLAVYEDGETLQELGDLHLRFGDYAAAEAAFRKVLARDPDAVAAHTGLGIASSRREDYPAAVRHFEAAHRLHRWDLDVWSNLAEAYLKVDDKKPRQIDKAAAEYRQILRIAPDHLDSRIGIAEVHIAMADAGEPESYQAAIDHHSRALQLGERGLGSKRLRRRELAMLRYSRGYARVKLYESAKPFGVEALLGEALRDFQACVALDPDHWKAVAAKSKLDDRLGRGTRRGLPESAALVLVLLPTLFVLLLAQSTYYFGVPALKAPLESTAYVAITFGALVFVVVGLFLPEIQKLKGAGIELEKGTVTRISASSSISISR